MNYTYIIKNDENLSSVAAKLTGNTAKWIELLSVNPGIQVTYTVYNNRRVPVAHVYVGQKINVPSNWIGSRVKAKKFGTGNGLVGTKPIQESGIPPWQEPGNIAGSIKKWLGEITSDKSRNGLQELVYYFCDFDVQKLDIKNIEKMNYTPAQVLSLCVMDASNWLKSKYGGVISDEGKTNGILTSKWYSFEEIDLINGINMAKQFFIAYVKDKQCKGDTTCPLGQIWDVKSCLCVVGESVEFQKDCGTKSFKDCKPDETWSQSDCACLPGLPKGCPLKVCPEGLYLDPYTCRCATKPKECPTEACPEGKERNPKTCECVDIVKVGEKDEGKCPEGIVTDCPEGKVWDQKQCKCIVPVVQPPAKDNTLWYVLGGLVILGGAGAGYYYYSKNKNKSTKSVSSPELAAGEPVRQIAKLYVGVYRPRQPYTPLEIDVFRSLYFPEANTHPQYMYVIGPFKTKAAAEIMAQAVRTQNPHIQTVAQAEKLAKRVR